MASTGCSSNRSLHPDTPRSAGSESGSQQPPGIIEGFLDCSKLLAGRGGILRSESQGSRWS